MILRWQMAGLANWLTAVLRQRPKDIAFIAIAGTALLAFQAANIYLDLVQEVAKIRQAWPTIALAGMAFAGLAGLFAGRRLTAFCHRLASAPWIGVLPWPDHVRLHAARRAAIWLGAPWGAGAALLGWMLASAISAPNPIACAACPSAAFMAVFALAVFWPRRPGFLQAAEAPPVAAPNGLARLRRLAGYVDQARPRWAGTWALGPERSGFWWPAVLALGIGFAACISLVQRQAWPSLLMAVAGGHAVFLGMLRGAPLLSPVLTTSSVGFGAAWAAMARLPLALSYIWFLLAALPALTLSAAAWRQSCGAAFCLALLNGLFAACLAITPWSRRQACLLHALALLAMLQQGLEYGPAYGILAMVLILCLAAYLLHRARQKFRAHG